MRFTITLSIDIDDPPNTLLEHPADATSQAFISQRTYVESAVEVMVESVAPLAEFQWARIDVDTGRQCPDFEYDGRTYPGAPIVHTVTVNGAPSRGGAWR